MKPAPTGRFPPLAPWAMVAAVGLAAAWTAQLYFSTRQENRLLHDELHMAQLDSQLVVNQLAEERLVGSRTVAVLKAALDRATDPSRWRPALLVAPGGPALSPAGPFAIAGWNPDTARGFVLAHRLPPPGPGYDYHLWLLPPQPVPLGNPGGPPAPTDLGVLKAGPQANTFRATFSAPARQPMAERRLAISRERAGRAPKRPVEPFVLQGR